MAVTRTVEGTSASGNLQEALEDALQKAQQATDVADDLIKWKLSCVTGERGGIAGFNRVTITIETESVG